MVLLSLVGAPDVLGIEEFVFVSFGLATVTVGTGLGVVVVVEVVVVLLGETAPGLDGVEFGLTTSGFGVVALEVGATDPGLAVVVVVVGVAAPDLGVTPPVSLVGDCEPCVDVGCGVCFCVVVGATLVLEPPDPCALGAGVPVLVTLADVDLSADPGLAVVDCVLALFAEDTEPLEGGPVIGEAKEDPFLSGRAFTTVVVFLSRFVVVACPFIVVVAPASVLLSGIDGLAFAPVVVGFSVFGLAVLGLGPVVIGAGIFELWVTAGAAAEGPLVVDNLLELFVFSTF